MYLVRSRTVNPANAMTVSVTRETAVITLSQARSERKRRSSRRSSPPPSSESTGSRLTAPITRLSEANLEKEEEKEKKEKSE